LPAGKPVELDVILAPTDVEVENELRRFRAARKVKDGDGLFAAALVGAPDAVFGFADFSATSMIEAFVERVLPGLATHR